MSLSLIFQTGNSPDQVCFSLYSLKQQRIQHQLEDDDTPEDLGMGPTDYLKVLITRRNPDYDSLDY